MKRFHKFNQDHDEHGRFTGPGTSHQPTGNPVGRPASNAPAASGPSTKQIVGSTIASTIGATAGGYAGATAMGELGAAIGGLGGPLAPVTVPLGAALGSVAGKMAGDVLGSIAGDYVATKIGSSLLGLKEARDQHGIGLGTQIGQYGAAGAAWAGSHFLPGPIGAVARSLFSPSNFSLASEGAKGVVDAAGGIAGGLAGAKVGAKLPEKAGEDADRLSRDIGRGKKAGAVRRIVSQVGKSGTAYNGSFASLATETSYPQLFGPKAWAKVKDTPFGGYIRSKVKEIADKMDDAAAMHDIDLKPAPKAHVNAVKDLAGQQTMQQEEEANQQKLMAQQQAMQPAGPPGSGDGGAPMRKSLFAKDFTMPMRAPNDAVSRDAMRTGGAANVAFLHRMQAIETESRRQQIARLSQGPRVENLMVKPGEDEQMYYDRIQQLMRRSVEASDQTRRSLFGMPQRSGEAGLSNLFPEQTHTYQVRLKKGRKTGPAPWTIQAAIAKEFNGPVNLDQGLVYGWASIIQKDGKEVTDHQDDRITEPELVAAAHDFIQNSRNGGVLHDEYGKHIGHIVESVVFTKDMQHALGIDLGKVGWLIGYKITDPRVKFLVKSRTLKAFSIGGKGRRVPAND